MLGSPNSLNRYAYVAGDPVNATDPSGMSAVCMGPTGFTGEGYGPGFNYSCSPTIVSSGGMQISTGSMIGQMGGQNSSGETGYVLGTVIPGYMGSMTLANGTASGLALPANYSFGNSEMTVSVSYSGLLPGTSVSTTSLISAFSALGSGWTPGSGPAYTQISMTVPYFFGGIVGVGASFTVDANGSYWIGPTASVGFSLPVSFSAVTGTGPSSGSLSDFLQGWSWGWGAGAIYGVGGQWSNTAQGTQYSFEHGFYTPQIGINGGYNFCVSLTGCP